eukprot:scaffold4817_cov123-Skeletonema_dohrnii-CCMP3373.AAC.12
MYNNSFNLVQNSDSQEQSIAFHFIQKENPVCQLLSEKGVTSTLSNLVIHSYEVSATSQNKPFQNVCVMQSIAPHD